jgi:hypothetical protein
VIKNSSDLILIIKWWNLERCSALGTSKKSSTGWGPISGTGNQQEREEGTTQILRSPSYRSCVAADFQQRRRHMEGGDGSDVGRGAMCEECSTLGERRHGRRDDGDVVGVQEWGSGWRRCGRREARDRRVRVWRQSLCQVIDGSQLRGT